MDRIISFIDIKPIDRFESILLEIRKKVDTTIALCHKHKQYNKSISTYIKFITQIISALEDDLENGQYKKDIWNENEAFICLLYSHLLIIDLNQTAHMYLNPGLCKFESSTKQLQQLLDGQKKIYGNVKIIE